mgnify:FL=1
MFMKTIYVFVVIFVLITITLFLMTTPGSGGRSLAWTFVLFFVIGVWACWKTASAHWKKNDMKEETPVRSIRER